MKDRMFGADGVFNRCPLCRGGCYGLVLRMVNGRLRAILTTRDLGAMPHALNRWPRGGYWWRAPDA